MSKYKYNLNKHHQIKCIVWFHLWFVWSFELFTIYPSFTWIYIVSHYLQPSAKMLTPSLVPSVRRKKARWSEWLPQNYVMFTLNDTCVYCIVLKGSRRFKSWALMKNLLIIPIFLLTTSFIHSVMNNDERHERVFTQRKVCWSCSFAYHVTISCNHLFTLKYKPISF